MAKFVAVSGPRGQQAARVQVQEVPKTAERAPSKAYYMYRTAIGASASQMTADLFTAAGVAPLASLCPAQALLYIDCSLGALPLAKMSTRKIRLHPTDGTLHNPSAIRETQGSDR